MQKNSVNMAHQKIIFSALVISAAIFTLSDAKKVFRENYYGGDESFFYLMKLLRFPQKPERFGRYDKYPQSNQPKVYEYHWQSCGPSTDPVKANIELSPDPLPIPGNVTVSGNGSLQVDVAGPVKLALNIQKKVLVWITIPCVDGVGSCTYDDACELLDQAFPGDTCPVPLSTYNIPCHCPFKAGNYSLPPSVIEVENISIPSWLTTGDYKVKATLTASDGSQLACYDVAFTLN